MSPFLTSLERVIRMPTLEQRSQELIEAGRWLYQQGMVPATSGNFSARLDDGNIAITVSGRHKGKLVASDIMLINSEGQSLDGQTPSAETLLHVQIYRVFPDTGVILHPHSQNATVLSRLKKDSVILEGYELLKAFSGIKTHQTRLQVPVFDNDQNIARLASKIDPNLTETENMYGYMLRGHGFYTWGKTIDDALRHVEAFEFLFGCELKHGNR
jgi:methylthioribulose-1-phosphate dehydratase